MVLRVMDEHHENRTIGKLRPIVGIAEDQHRAPKRHDNGGVGKRLPMNQHIGRRPDALLAVKRSGDITNEDGCANRVNPHEQGGTGKHHRKGRHGSNPAQIPLSIILLGVSGTNVSTLDIPGPAFLDQRTTDILPDIVSHKDQRDPITTAKVGERNANLVSGTEREHIPPMRG
jgi:hypothetical protein